MQSGAKRAISKINFILWVYAYILSMCKGCVCVMNTIDCCAPHTPHRWTAITVGALRAHTARGPLSTMIFLQTRYFCASMSSWIISIISRVHCISCSSLSNRMCRSVSVHFSFILALIFGHVNEYCDFDC